MIPFDDLVPEHVRRLGGYQPGKSIKRAEEESGVRCIKLASNENPFGPSPLAIEAINRVSRDLHLYPDHDCTELQAVLAERHQLDPGQVLVTCGSSDMLAIVARTLLGPGLNAVTSSCSFIVYPIVTRATGAEFREAPMRDYGYDLDGLRGTIDDSTRVVYISNPNNPTGSMISLEELEGFLDRVPERVTVVLDEAYYDFAQYAAEQRGVDYSHSLRYIREGRNLVVLRTFSKAHGLAGARVGYGLAPAGLLQYFARMKTVFTVSASAEAAAVAALQDTAHIRKSLENNYAGAAGMSEKLRGMGFRVLPTWANFLYVDVGEDCVAFAKRMLSEGVIIRPLRGWGAAHAIRITIGTPAQNDICVAAMKKVAPVASR